MRWVLVCINMYRCERNFGSFYCYPTLAREVMGQFRDVISALSTAIQQFKGSTPTSWMIAVFIEIQHQEKNLPPMRLCSGKMWKSNVKKFFFHIISHVGLSELSHTTCGTQVIAQSLKTHQQNGPKLEILQTVTNTCLIINILSSWLIWKKIKIKTILRNKNYVTYRKMIILI